MAPTEVNVEKHHAMDHEALAAKDGSEASFNGVLENIDANDAEAKKVLHKIDRHLLPMLCVTYLIQVRPFNISLIPLLMDRSSSTRAVSHTQHYGE